MLLGSGVGGEGDGGAGEGGEGPGAVVGDGGAGEGGEGPGAVVGDGGTGEGGEGPGAVVGDGGAGEEGEGPGGVGALPTLYESWNPLRGDIGPESKVRTTIREAGTTKVVGMLLGPELCSNVCRMLGSSFQSQSSVCEPDLG